MGDQQGGGAGERPDVLTDVSETQIDELERQFNEGDEGEWGRITESYGWTAEQSQVVWNWFKERPTAAQGWPDAESGGQS